MHKLKCVETIAQRLDLTMAQVSLGYLLAHPFPVFPILGCKNSSQLEDSCAAGDVLLDDQAFAELRRI